MARMAPACGTSTTLATSLRGRRLAVDETVILLHPPLPLVGASTVTERERPRNDSTLVING